MDHVLLQSIIGARNYDNAVPFDHYPMPGEYILTGMQAGNIRGERGWQLYLGYVVQVRRKGGAFGSDMVLMRHPDGTLMRHENQTYYRIDDCLLEQAKSLFITIPEEEDYTVAFTLANNTFPETGKIIEPKKDGPPVDNSPMATITISRSDGTKTIEVV